MLSKITLLVFVMITLSCKPLERVPQDERENEREVIAEKISAEKMLEDGYLPGRIIFSDIEDDCRYTIQLKDDKTEFYYVDPINLSDEFHRDGQTVWVKFTGLRRANRCSKANPVELNAIENRDE
ncbi:hypothetical protein [Aequorivita echinoideorum]|uniref:Uncharacterized protein n=1 Tax=Aequorivita echinoideorum TaxID=1549647 RepID=A0ABS5S109_9FLAO|nr:hypothetical protein [Aequorivita echinoideorum]MBT0606908.1 hypothetical protein [Aequorivita echinoideorum]